MKYELISYYKLFNKVTINLEYIKVLNHKNYKNLLNTEKKNH